MEVGGCGGERGERRLVLMLVSLVLEVLVLVLVLVWRCEVVALGVVVCCW